MVSLVTVTAIVTLRCRYLRQISRIVAKMSAATTHNNNESDDDYVEAVVCKDSDIKENEMKTFDLADAGQVLLIRQKNKLSALGTKCTHYGAPLSGAALGNGRIRCQWHGACFDINNGDIEDFPGLDSLPCYQVSVVNNDVKVRAKRTELETNKRLKQMTKRDKNVTQNIVIIGGGPSGAVCAETLRQESFSGALTLICKENYLPYDRVQVNKAKDLPLSKIQFRNEQFYEDNGIDVIKGAEAISVDAGKKTVNLSNGRRLNYDKLYVATGLKAIKTDIPGKDLKNVVTIRNYDDGHFIKAFIKPDSKIIILGSSFIAMESSAFCCLQGAEDVRIVMRNNLPYKFLGEKVGAAFKKYVETKGVKFFSNSGIKRCIDKGNGTVGKVELTDGTIMDADLVIMGVGSNCLTDFLKNSGIDLKSDGTVEVNEYLQSNNSDVYVGGDIARAPVWSHNNNKAQIGHFGLAQHHGRIAALNMLGKKKKLKVVPYFFSKVFDMVLRYVGYGNFDDVLYVGDVDNLQFAAFYLKGDEVVAACSVRKDPVVSQFAEILAQGKKLYRGDVEGDENFRWTRKLL